MKALIINSVYSQKPRQVATDLIRSETVSNPTIFTQALKNWLSIHVDIVDEFEELLIGPERMIDEIWGSGRAFGDCDDVAMLAAAILASIGASVQLVAAFPQPDGSYAHVFVRYRFPHEPDYSDFDPTIPFRGVYPPEVLTVDIVS